MAKRNESGYRGKRNFIVAILTAAVLLFCVVSSLQDRMGWELGLPKLPALDWLEELLDDALDDSPKLTSSLEDATLQVYMIDVGQGESILVRTAETVMLIDSGERDQELRVLSFLDSLGIERIDILIATHPHSDHMGSMAAVIRDKEVGRIIMPDIPREIMPTSQSFTNLLEAIAEKKLRLTQAVQGDVYELGEDTTMTILGPVKDYDDLNNLSVVCRVDSGEVSFLFTGDMEKKAEKDLLAAGVNLNADVLGVGHHGSSTSSHVDFFEAVGPEIALISCGVDNSYGHPHREVLSLLSGCTVYRTDRDGTVLVETNGREIAVERER